MNRYIKVQLKRLSLMDDKSYWRVSMFLLCRSRVFFISFLQIIFPRWHREYSLREILSYWDDYRKIANFVRSPKKDRKT